jgi:hypothetical protein
MPTSYEGVFRHGKIELLESPPEELEGKVIVTFLGNGTHDDVADVRGTVDLADRGIDTQQAADLRQRLKPFADDWSRPDMDAYDAD